MKYTISKQQHFREQGMYYAHFLSETAISLRHLVRETLTDYIYNNNNIIFASHCNSPFAV